MSMTSSGSAIGSLLALGLFAATASADDRCDLAAQQPLTERVLMERLAMALELPPRPYRIQWQQPTFPIPNPNAVCLNFEIEAADIDDRGSMRLQLLFEAEGFRAGRLEARGRLIKQREALVPLQTLASGTPLSAAKVERIVLDARRVGDDVLTDPDAVDGWIARTRLNAGRPIRGDDLMAPFAIEADDPLRVVYRSKALTLERPGTARDAARLGDLVEVEIANGTILTARLIADGLAEIEHLP